MLSELHQLAEKLGRLAELSVSLRRENADLRLQLAVARNEAAELSRRMQLASDRVAALIDRLPADSGGEAA